MLTDYSQFKGAISIPSLDTEYIRENLKSVIDDREPEICADLVGKEKYNELVLLKEGDPSAISPEDQDLIDRLSKISAYYVWYWFSRENNTYLASGGAATTKQENADRANPATKQTENWNRMHDFIFDKHNGLVTRDDLAQLEVFKRTRIRCEYARINPLNFL